MSLALYLDDCAYHKVLASLLRAAGHSITFPKEAGIAKAKDPVHFDYARSHGLILVTKNARDFFDLHRQTSKHPGIFAIYQDNDVSRDMTHAEVVNAIANIEKSGVGIADQFHVLNHWRFASAS